MEIVIRGGLRNGEKQEVPCGKCGACLYNRTEDWTLRIIAESKSAINSWFITLTYSDDNLPRTEEGLISLRKKDFQDFMKVLRIKVDRMPGKKYQEQMLEQKPDKRDWRSRIRYYAVGEYGSKTFRPHYHIIAFNIPKSIIESLDQVWKKGLIHIGSVTPNSIAYTVSYHVTTKNQEVTKDTTMENEFATMSRRPGLGTAYLDNKDWHEKNYERSWLVTDIKSDFRDFIKNAYLQIHKEQRLRQLLEWSTRKLETRKEKHLRITTLQTLGRSTRTLITN